MLVSTLVSCLVLRQSIIRNVQVVDVATLTVKPNQAVAINGDKIAWIRPDHSVAISEEAQAEVVDGKGGYLIPGLTDSHIHFNNPYRESRLMLAHGVTSARDMGGNNLEKAQWRKLAESGTYNGFTFTTCGVILDGDPAYHFGSRGCGSEADGREAVKDQAAAKFDHIKVYSGLKREVFMAIAEEAKRRRKPIDGHVPNAMSMMEAAKAGQRSMEHFYRAESLLRPFLPDFKPESAVFEQGIFSDFQSLQREPLKAELQKLAKYGAVISPTLILSEGQARLPVDEERLAAWKTYVPKSDVEAWTSKIPEQYAAYGESLKRGFKNMQALVKLMDEAGLPAVVGTDLGNGYAMAGRGVWDEMDLWAKGGIEPGRVLRAATLTPAQAFGYRDRGEIKPGRKANLVLLAENPLRDTRAIRSIQSVWAQGQHFNRTGIDRLLQEAKSDLGRDIPDPAKIFLPQAGTTGKAQHLFLTYGDFTESFVELKRGSSQTLHAALDMRTYGRVPLVMRAEELVDGGWSVTLRAMAKSPSEFNLKVGAKMPTQLLLTPSLSLDNVQLRSLMSRSPLPQTLSVVSYRGRQSQVADRMILERVKASSGGPNLRLRSLQSPGYSVWYWQSETGKITKKQMNEFSFARSAELVAK